MGLEMTGQSSGSVDQALSKNIDAGQAVLIATMEYMKWRIENGDYTPRADGVDLSDFTLVEYLYPEDEETGEVIQVATATRLFFKGSAADLGLDAPLLDKLDVSRSNGNYLGVAITNVACAKESTERIQKQIDDLSEFKKEFAEFYANVPEEGYPDDGRELKFELGRNGHDTGAGAYSVVPTSELERLRRSAIGFTAPTPEEHGIPGTSADMRIERPRNEMDAFIKKADSFFKDNIYSYLGLGSGGFDADKVMENAANAHTIKTGSVGDPYWDINGNYSGPPLVSYPKMNLIDIQLPVGELYIEDDTPKKPFDPENPKSFYL